MKTKMILFSILILSILFSASRASASPGDGARAERQRYIVQAAKAGHRAYVVEVYGHGEYAVTVSANGQSASDLMTGTRFGVQYPDGLLVVSVAAMDGGALCRIYDHTGATVARVNGGMAATCTVR